MRSLSVKLMRNKGVSTLYLKAHIDDALLDDIRGATNKGLAIGNDRFKDQVAALTGRRLTPGKPGPKREQFLR